MQYYTRTEVYAARTMKDKSIEHAARTSAISITGIFLHLVTLVG